jgi:hypothetical protein
VKTFLASVRGLAVIAGLGWLPAVGRAENVDYLKQVKPLLEARCYACHGALKQNGKLRLDTVASALKGGSSGPAIVPGEPDKSPLILRVSAQDAAERMPPEHEGSPLTGAEIDLLRKWIRAGASHPADEKPEADPREHWAFRPITRPTPPQVKNAAWVRNPIDAFVAQQHERRGLTPQPEADRVILLRRLSLDLIGLPPTPEEIAAVAADPRPDWYERTVNRLLDDPRYGERWARHWMDIWRYSDWWGLGNELRNSQKHIWHWRDWIIESLNNDVSYDEMIRQMLAADELYPNDLNKLRATGFLARNYFLFNRHQWMDETVEHVSKAFLGLTMNCVRCHDHKYDPFPQISYYQLRAFFEPYHVRLDVLPGEPNLERNGLPRVFDAWPDDPTYRFVRGDEKNPDTSRSIAPGIPKILTPELPEIQPVELPPEAWQPQRRAWVVQNHIHQARQKLASAEGHLAKIQAEIARRTTTAAENRPAQKPPAAGEKNELRGVEKFDKLDPKRWKQFGGQWKQHPNGLEQKQDGAQRAVLRWLEKAPRDFDATFRFTLLGGSQWRSIGLSFDAADDPTKDTAKTYHEQLVYVSAYAGGSKIQAAYNDGGQWHYPPAPAVRPLPIQLQREYTLRVQVRDRTINAFLNGAPVLACQTPLARRDGHLQLITFDASAVFHEFRVEPLPANVQLLPSDSPLLTGELPPTRADLQAEQAIAEAQVELARAELAAVERRAAAWQAIWSQAAASEQRSQHAAAIRAARELTVAQARHALAVAQREHQRATTPDQHAAAAKAVQTAQAALQQAQAALAAEISPTEKLEEFVGARWTPTRFRSSTADDPAPKFLPQSTGRRTALARWITDPRNTLTARVAVNHIWNRHFGTPLVPTVFDFGRKGQPPTHPELLDWLASEFVEKGWSMKHLHRLIVQSATYRLASSATSADNRTRDPDNVYLWRRTPVRMESQVVRDSLLALADQLDPRMGGPPVPPAEQAASKRRSLYFFHSNNERNLFLTTFDEALVTDCYRREQSIVPQQALAMTNSRLVLDVSRPIAERLSQWLRTQTSAESDEAFVRAAFRVLLAHTPSERECDACLQALAQWRKLPEAGRDMAATTFARAQLIGVLLNHNDFIMIR